MQKSGTIILQGKFQQSGFGFSCLQQASNLNITGKFTYLSSEKVQILLTGSDSNIQQFHLWCKSQKMVISGNLSTAPEPSYYSEFEISNQL